MRLTTDQSYCDYIMCDADPGDCGGTCNAREMWEALRDYERHATPIPTEERAQVLSYYTVKRIYCPKCGKEQKRICRTKPGWYCERCGQALFYQKGIKA